MMGILRNTTELSHALSEGYLSADIIAVDATCGNGHDTLWLAERCRRVYSFDIQEKAVETAEKLTEEHDNITYIVDSHENIKEYIDEPVGYIIFNLGYLPGGDKNITTIADSTMKAVADGLELLSAGGLMCIVMYWGHDAGKIERKRVIDFAENLDKRTYHVIKTDMLNQDGTPPEILLIEKKK